MPELIRPTQAELDRMSHPEKDALILWLFDMLARHEQQLSEVERKVEKTSQNSSKPPSSDGFKKGPAKPRQTAVAPARVEVSVIDDFRWAILGSEAGIYWPGFVLSWGVIGFLLWLGIGQFRRIEKNFADLI